VQYFEWQAQNKMKINDQRAHNQLQAKKRLDPVDLAAIAAQNNTEDWKGLPSSEVSGIHVTLAEEMHVNLRVQK
jgi:hypothetical protein